MFISVIIMATEQKPVDDWWILLMILVIGSLPVAGYMIFGLIKLGKFIHQKCLEAQEKKRITCDSSNMPEYEAFYEDL